MEPERVPGPSGSAITEVQFARDHQVGRIIDYLEESGQLDNTIVIYAADNGASGEGSPNGSVNEGKFANAYPDSIEANLAMIDQLGTPDTYNHYPIGWAVAFSRR
jgi:arylsulfatase